MKERNLEARTLPLVLTSLADEAPDRILMSDELGNLTRAKAVISAGRVRSGLATLGVSKGDCVAIMMGNSRAFIESWFGCAFLGAVEVPINPDERGERLVHVLNHSQSRVAIVDVECLHELERRQDQLESLQRLVVVGDGRSPAFDCLTFDELRASKADVDPNAATFADPVAVMYTSGSTGPAKGAVLSHAHHFANGLQPASLFDIRAEDVVFVCLPLHHNMAQGYGVWPALIGGARIRLEAKFDYRQFWLQVRAARATVWPFVGAMLPLLLKQPPAPNDLDNQLRVAYGVPIPASLQRDFESRFRVDLVHCYGSTEATIVTWNVGPSSVVGSAGAPLSEYEVRIHDEWDRPMDVETVGEICIRPREPYSMFSGYFRDAERTVAVWRNLWFHTGDRGRLDPAGNLWFADRIGDSIRRMGVAISAYEVENALLAHPQVRLAAAFGVPSVLTEEELMVAVVLQPNEELSAEALRAWCEANLAPRAVPRYIEFVSELPMTPTGKIEKYRLRIRGVTSDTNDARAEPGAKPSD